MAKLKYTFPPPVRSNKVGQLKFQVDEGTKRLVSKILHDCRDRLGWMTEGDFLRWCLWEGLIRLTNDLKNSEIRTDCALVQASLTMLVEEEAKDRTNQVLDKSRKLVAELAGKGPAAQEEIRRQMKGIAKNIQEMSDDNYYVREFKRKWQSEFGDWVTEVPTEPVAVVKPKKKINLKPSKASEPENPIDNTTGSSAS